MFTFTDALTKVGIDPHDLALIFHTPKEQAFRRALPLLVQERRALFEYFQSYHSSSVEPTLKARSWMASFVSVDDGMMAFVGIYERRGWSDTPVDEIGVNMDALTLHNEFGVPLLSAHCRKVGVASWAIFDFQLTEKLALLHGRLMVGKPLGRRYVRRAEQLDAEIVALTARPALVPPPPDWQGFILSAAEVSAIPGAWAARLAEWRGVYLIVDTQDGARYVGSAYGEDNLLGRWRAHVRGDHGVTAALSHRKTHGFRFSILERVSPDMEEREIIAVESSWKLRLDTITHGLNRN